MTGKQRRKLRKKVSRLAAKPEKMEGETSFLGKGKGRVRAGLYMHLRVSVEYMSF